MANNNKPTKEVIEFHKLNVSEFMRIKEKIEEKRFRKTIKNLAVLENGCVAFKTCDIIYYQFTPERVNEMMGTTLNDLDELEEYIQNADDEIIARMIKSDNLIFNQKIEYSYCESDEK